MTRQTHSVTEILRNWRAGDRATLEEVIPLVERELRRRAARYLRRERPNHSLQAVDLVQETYIRLIHTKDIQWQDRAHFYGISANLMRRILVDYARKHNAEKRNRSESRPVSENDDAAADRLIDLVAVDEALERLAMLDPQQCRVVELRYFSGLSVEETADVLGTSPRTVKRDWQMAKAWLRAEICPPPRPD
jgi:RNA polymerase sigma factor (TIGR02999 family)